MSERAVGGVLAEWAFLWGLYILFAGSTARPEVIVGAVVSGIAAAVSHAARATTLAAFRPHPRWLLPVVRLPLMIGHDSALLVWGLVRRAIGRPAAGRLFEIPFDAVGTDASSAAHRALTVGFTSLPPNTYVIDLDLDRRAAVVHRLVPTGARPRLVLPRRRP